MSRLMAFKTAVNPKRRKPASRSPLCRSTLSHSAKIFAACLPAMRGTICLPTLRVFSLGMVEFQSSYSRTREAVSRLSELPNLDGNYKGHEPEKGRATRGAAQQRWSMGVYEAN